MTSWKKAGILFLIIVMGLFATACGSQEKKEAVADGKKKIVAVTHAQFPPFEYMSPSGKPEGFDIDIINAIGKELGWEVEVQDTGFDGALEQVKTGKAQVAIAAITITDKRKQDYAFSDSYFEAKQLLMVPENSPIKSVQDIKGKRVAVQSATTGALLAEEMLGKGSPNVHQMEDLASAMDELYNKRVDAVIGDMQPVLEQMKKNAKPGYTTIDDPNVPKEFYGILMNKKDAEMVKQVNEALKKIKENGTYDQIYNKYFLKK
jgi:ABC-type amino acid transport substrate-binding protein